MVRLTITRQVRFPQRRRSWQSLWRRCIGLIVTIAKLALLNAGQHPTGGAWGGKLTRQAKTTRRHLPDDKLGTKQPVPRS
eukprot:3861949-Amphidinium_carterae.1